MLDVDHPRGQVSGAGPSRAGPGSSLHLSQAGRVDVESPAKTTRPRGSVARFALLRTLGRRRRRGRSWCASTGPSARRPGGYWLPGDDGPLEGLGPEARLGGLRRTDPHQHQLPAPAQRSAGSEGGGRHRAGLGRRHPAPAPACRRSPRCGSLDAEERERLLAATTHGARRGPGPRAHPDGRAVGGQAGRSLRRAREVRPALPDARMCGDEMRRVSFESYEMTYCATCQTGGKVLADRRMSRLLK